MALWPMLFLHHNRIVQPVKKEVLVLVESWGLIEDTALQREVLSPWHQNDLSSSYRVREGHQLYKFLTQAGEFREITGYLFHSYQANPKWLNEKSLARQKSIFIKKQQEGFRVIGLHGFSSEFYKRKVIWPALGIQETMFADDFRKSSLSLCGDVSFSWYMRYIDQHVDVEQDEQPA